MENIKQNKKLIYTAFFGGLLLILLASFAVYLFNDKPNVTNENEGEEDITYQVVAESGDAVLMADTGLNMEWLVDEEDGRRQVFERLRLISKSQFEDFTGTETQVDSMDITEENAKVFLTYPDGNREEITTDNPYILFSVYPPEPLGAYKVEVKLNSGPEYNFEFNFNLPEKTQLLGTDQIQTVELLEEDIFGRSKVELRAYNLGNTELDKASKVFHITPEGGVYGGALKEARASADIDNYFWLDTQALKENYDITQGSITVLQQEDRSELSPSELDYLEKHERPTAFEHIFLAKVDNTWYYAVANYPDDF